MADIRIHRPHRLGLAKAREVAWQWAEEVEQRFDMSCTVIEGGEGDTVEFQRAGVEGRLLVRADRFDLEARLGYLLGAFSSRIEAEIERNLDALLAAQAKPKGALARPRSTRAASGEPPVATSKGPKSPPKAPSPSGRARTVMPAKRSSAK
jgi:putative polyhydroxyalkanoate system protein